MNEQLDLDDRAATLSDCGLYRYDLTRRWGHAGPCSTALFVMLNPSTADASEDDPTIRRCIGFAKREGCGGLAVVNLYALRSADPSILLRYSDPFGPDNQATIERWLADPSVYVAIAAWGSWWRNQRSRPMRLNVEQLAQQAGRHLYCLGTTKAGDPRHPLYVRADAPLQRFAAPADPGDTSATVPAC